jgi:sugar (pentulose or hexulose) kinase
MMADALGRPVTACTEPETSCRGAALWAMERAGIIGDIADLPASTGGVFEPRPEYRETYERLRDAQHALYEKLFTS